MLIVIDSFVNCSTASYSVTCTGASSIKDRNRDFISVFNRTFYYAETLVLSLIKLLIIKRLCFCL